MDTSKNDRLKIARERLGLTRTQMAEILGMSFSGYAMIERGERGLRIQHIINICEKTDISRTWLENGTGEMLKSDKNQTLFDLLMTLSDTDRELMIGIIRRLAETTKKDT